jgi:hypothetical protein
VLASRLTSVERLKLIAGDFGIVHALKKRVDARIFFTPKIVGNCKGQLD